jgi:uncharacterized protein (DUF58 family)
MRRAVALLGVAGLLVLAGGAIDSATLFALAVAAVIVATAAVATTALAVRRLEVSRTLATAEVVEGEDVAVRFRVRGVARLPVRLEARDADGAWVAIGPQDGAVTLRVARRGAHVVGPSLLRVVDDLGLVRRVVRAGGEHPLLVLPAPTPPLVALPGGRAHRGDPEPDGLRAYVPGTPVSRIHWASLARGAQLQERRLVAAPTGLPLVVVDTAAAPDAAAVDWAARAAAGAVRELVRAGGCRVLLPGQRTAMSVTAVEGWPTVHRALARMGVGAPGAPSGEGEIVRIDAAAAPAQATRAALPDGVVALASARLAA